MPLHFKSRLPALLWLLCLWPALALGQAPESEEWNAKFQATYVWQGKREEGPEVAAFIKTRRALVDEAIATARPLHPYTVPCFLVLPIEQGNEDYLAWAREQTK